MNYLFYAIIGLYAFILGLIALVAVFCYKQDNINLLLRSKTKIKDSDNEIASEISVDIDKPEKEKK